MKIHIKNTDIRYYIHNNSFYQILALKAIINDGWIDNVCDAKPPLNYIFSILNYKWINSFIIHNNSKYYFARCERTC